MSDCKCYREKDLVKLGYIGDKTINEKTKTLNKASLRMFPDFFAGPHASIVLSFLRLLVSKIHNVQLLNSKHQQPGLV